jgi:Protein of unknown function (DUF3460)
MKDLYESDFTSFMNEFIDSNPRVAEKQMKYRGTWWDKEVNFDELKKLEDAEVPRGSYAYYDAPSTKP